jgi:hypothetical protein
MPRGDRKQGCAELKEEEKEESIKKKRRCHGGIANMVVRN